MIAIIDSKGQKKLLNDKHIVSVSIRENSMKHNFSVTISLTTREEDIYRTCPTSAEATVALEELNALLRPGN